MISRDLLPALFFLIVMLSGCISDAKESSHATRAAAVDAIGRGWIPGVLPSSAVDIREWHNLDTNVGHGSFSFGTADLQSFKEALRPMPMAHAARSRSRDDLEASGYDFYLYEDFEIAVNWADRKGQFWLIPGQ